MTRTRYAIARDIEPAMIASASSDTSLTQVGYFTVDVDDSTSTAAATWKYPLTAGTSSDYHQFWIVGDPRPHYIQNGQHWQANWPDPQEGQMWFNPQIGELSTWNGSRWIGIKQYQHKPEDFVYRPGKKAKGLAPTQRLAPIEEMIEVEGVTKVLEHYARLLQDPRYREEQLEYLNEINKSAGAPEVKYDEDAILFKIQRLFGTQKAIAALAQLIEPSEVRYTHGYETDSAAFVLKNISIPVLVERLRKIEEEKEQLKKLKLVNARTLLKTVLTAAELEALELHGKLLVSRLGTSYEILKTGKVNKLLPDGKKQGLCLISRLCGLPTDDIIAMKKLLLVTSPTLFEKTANKTSPFH